MSKKKVVKVQGKVALPYLEAKGRITCIKCKRLVTRMFQCVDCGTFNCQSCSILTDVRTCKICSDSRKVILLKLEDIKTKYKDHVVDEYLVVQGVPVKMLSRDDLIKIYVAKATS